MYSQDQKIKAELKKLAEHGKLKRKGYVIEKKHIKSNVMQYIRETLTVTPKVHKDYAQNVQSFRDDSHCLHRNVAQAYIRPTVSKPAC